MRASRSLNLLPVSGDAATKFGAEDLVGTGVGRVGGVYFLAAHCAASDIDDLPHRLHAIDDVTP